MKRDFTDNIPFGLPPLVVFLIALVTGIYIAFNPAETKDSDLEVWTFVYSHAVGYEERVERFEKEHNVEVQIQNVAFQPLMSRLRSAFWAELEVPDIVELEISGAGSMFRGRVEDVGFLDLTPFLKRDGLWDRLPAARLAPYQNRGNQFGMPLDIHPVMIAYRRDLFEEYGINPDELDTWDKFVQVGRRVTKTGERYMIQLQDSNHQSLEAFLFQRGGGYFDPDGNLIMDNEIAVETMLWLIPLVAGDGRISIPGSDQAFAQALESGYYFSLLCPDYLAHHITLVVPKLEGQMALMPLPAFEPGGRRTSTLGGTMMAITKRTEDPESAWELAKFLAFDESHLEERFRETGVIPPLRDAMTQDVMSEPSPYWSGQPVGEMYAALADDVPPQYASPYTSLAKAKMGDVVASCAMQYRRNGESGFEEFVRKRLKDAANDVRRAMTRNPFQAEETP